MVKFSFKFSFDEREAFFGFIDPLSIIVCNSKAEVDNISVISLFSWYNINKSDIEIKVSVFVLCFTEITI